MAQATLTDKRNNNVFNLGNILSISLVKEIDYNGYEKITPIWDNYNLTIYDLKLSKNYSFGYNLEIDLDLDNMIELKSLINSHLDKAIKEVKKSITYNNDRLSNPEFKKYKAETSKRILQLSDLLKKLEG